ncbi:MAG TPA: hypothetical protein PK147_09445, partial [Saprospiraceae bacterium]|nr:hypothetical protein [Saprospiraceae bacterium]
MIKTEYDIKVFKDLQDARLKDAWLRLEKETDAFPQSYYEWIEPWWKHNSADKELYIITAINRFNEIAGIAPF